MYRNIVYNNRTSEMKLFTWNTKGERIVRNIPYQPYYYTETGVSNPDAKSIFGTKLKKHTFQNDYERRQSIKNGDIDRIYNNLDVKQNFLIDAFHKHNKKKDFSKFDLSIFYIDIEVYSPDEFPEAWEANHPINVVTIYNSLKNEFRIFCLEHDFDPSGFVGENKKRYDDINKRSTLTVTTHRTENELLEALLSYWQVDYPDVVTGWNLVFDIPYIVNRIRKRLSMRHVNRLSPTGMVREFIRKKKISAQYSVEVQDFEMQGVTTLCYQEVYAKFNMNPVPNMKLDTILTIEVGKGKVDFESSNLAQLADDNWDVFVLYNIEDVNGLVLLEEKLKFMQVARMLAYMGLTPLNKSLDTLPIVNGYCAVNSYEEGKVIPTFVKNDIVWGKFEGAYVKEPIPGIYDNIVSFDLNSLYPMTMITLNTSPETKFGTVIERSNGNVVVEDNTGNQTEMTRENLDKLCKANDLALSKANILFTQKKKGIFPKMVDEVYTMRVSDRKIIGKNMDRLEELKGIEDQHVDEVDKLKAENIELDVMQYAKKIFINSCYGYLGNKYACMSDIDIAESITLTCQSVIKESCDILNRLAFKLANVKEGYDFIRYNDTDSAYMSIDEVVKHLGIPFLDENGNVNPKVVKLCAIIEDNLNKGIHNWGVDDLNSIDCRFKFKMEAIADKGFFIKKKKYILHVLNVEGYNVDKEEKRWKYKGVALVSAAMPKEVKPLVEKVVQKMIITGNRSQSDDLYFQAFDEFKALDIDGIAAIKATNKYNEYAKKCSGWNTAKGMLAHYRGAYYYNALIKEMGIANNYTAIKQSDKIKYVYLKTNNRWGLNVISYVDKYPKEFEKLFTIDTKLMFEKGVKDVVNQFYTALGWELRAPNKQTKVNVMDEFFLKS